MFVVLLLGGGAYFFMSAEPVVENTEAAAGQEPEKPVGKEIYYDLVKPLIVNFPKGSSANLIQVSISLLVNGNDTILAIRKHEPMIRNDLLMLISAKGSEKLSTKEGKEELRADMLKAIGKVMEKMTGENKVANIFFTSFVMQ